MFFFTDKVLCFLLFCFVDTQQDPPPGEGGGGPLDGSDRGLQGTPGQAVDGAGQDHKLQGADADE